MFDYRGIEIKTKIFTKYSTWTKTTFPPSFSYKIQVVVATLSRKEEKARKEQKRKAKGFELFQWKKRNQRWVLLLLLLLPLRRRGHWKTPMPTPITSRFALLFETFVLTFSRFNSSTFLCFFVYFMKWVFLKLLGFPIFIFVANSCKDLYFSLLALLILVLFWVSREDLSMWSFAFVLLLQLGFLMVLGKKKKRGWIFYFK